MLTGPARNCLEAERALERKVQQLEAEKEERVRWRGRKGKGGRWDSETVDLGALHKVLLLTHGGGGKERRREGGGRRERKRRGEGREGKKEGLALMSNGEYASGDHPP